LLETAAEDIRHCNFNQESRNQEKIPDGKTDTLAKNSRAGTVASDVERI
jgi:hypothetical protein